jgi:pseudaminic acid cytidylyltransferase
MKTLAIITARGGSKRIPRKNIKDFFGKPIIAWSIDIAIRSGIFDEVMVSTDDVDIANISKKYGAQIPFVRSEKNANDMAGTEDVILEVLNNYKIVNKQFDIVCCIYPTTPLMTVNRLVECKNKLLQGEFDTVFPIIRYGHPVQRALKIHDNRIKMAWPQYENTRTQDLEPYFHDAGQYYWLHVKQFVERKQIYSSNTGFIELSEMEAQDIDNIDDWNLAELKFKKINKLE